MTHVDVGDDAPTQQILEGITQETKWHVLALKLLFQGKNEGGMDGMQLASLSCFHHFLAVYCFLQLCDGKKHEAPILPLLIPLMLTEPHLITGMYTDTWSIIRSRDRSWN